MLTMPYWVESTVHASGIQSRDDVLHQTHESARSTTKSLGYPQDLKEASPRDECHHSHGVGVGGYRDGYLVRIEAASALYLPCAELSWKDETA